MNDALGSNQSRARRSPHLRFLVGLGASLLAWQLLPEVPQEQKLRLQLGAGSGAVRSLATRWHNDKHRTSGGFKLHYADGAPKRVNHALRLRNGDYVFAFEATDLDGDRISVQRRVTLQGTPVTLHLEPLVQ